MSDATSPPPAEVPSPVTPAAPPVATTEGLPVYEPLTPEMVEDEAVRGDFVMRWAVILLAVLLSCTLIVDTATLVHVKSGQYLSSHGFLPPARDVFTSTGEQLRWINLSWLFDIVTAAVYGVGSFIGLSVFKAVLAGLAFGFVVNTSRPGASTWWTSICAAFAVLACQPRFTAQPEVVTLVGVALTLWLLNRWLWKPESREIWKLVPLCIVWSNLDSRAWWGPFLLLLYGVGEGLGSVAGSPRLTTAGQRKTLWSAIGASWLGLMVNPFLWQSWIAPFTQFGTLYPAQLTYAQYRLDALPMTHPVGWFSHPVSMFAAALLFLLALVVLVINRRKIDFGHVLLLIGASVPALLATHEVGAAAIVFAVVAALNGQMWYGLTTTEDYSTETRALLFSRGGRAVTVLALFTLALLFTVGRLRPSGTGYVGLGIDPDLDGSINSYANVLKDSIDDRPFNFTIEQGDILVWTGKKPFIDHRLPIFAVETGTGETNSVIRLHQKLRLALAPKKQGALPKPSDRKFWKDEFNRLKITHCLPRLGGTAPDYSTFGALLSSTDWQFAKLDSATAVFYRRDLNDPKLKEFLAAHQFDMGDSYFKTEAELLRPRAGWAQLPTFYQRYIWKVADRPSPEVREARHLMGLAGVAGIRGTGLVYQAIRRAQEALEKNQNEAGAYEMLGRAYMFLMNIESQGRLDSQFGQLRYMQAVQAFNQALVAAPDNPDLHQTLFELYSINNRAELAYRELNEVYNWLNSQTTSDPEQENAQIQQLERTSKEMDRILKYLTQVETEAQKQPKAVRDSNYQLAAFYFQNGLSLKALELLQPADDQVVQPPQEMALRAELLLESGRSEEAYLLAGQLEGIAQQTGFTDWQRPRIASLLGNAEYTLAAQMWNRQADEEEMAGAARVLGTLVPRHFGAIGMPWPLTVTEASSRYFLVTPGTTSTLNAYAALIYLEAGQIKRAAEYFKLALDQNPNHPERPLLAFYLEKVTGKWVDFVPPNDRVPLEFAAE